MKNLKIRTAKEINNPDLNDLLVIADKLLPFEIEKLYIKLVNGFVNHASLTRSALDNKHMLENNSISLLYMSNEINTLDPNDSKKKEVIKKKCSALKTRRAILKLHENHYKAELDKSLDDMKEILREISEEKSIDDLDNDIYEYVVSGYLRLRKMCYKIIKYFTTLIISKEKLNPEYKDTLYIAVKSLEIFDLEKVLTSKNKDSLMILMNLITDYLSNQKADINRFKTALIELEGTEYSHFVKYLESAFSKEIKPISY